MEAADLEGALRRSPGTWASLEKSSLFITGGTGLLGRWLLSLLLRANSELNLGLTLSVLTRDRAGFVSRFPALALDPAVTLLEGDLRAFSFPTGEFTHAVHAAAELDPEHLEAEIAGTRRFLELCAQKRVRRALLLSSGAVYGTERGRAAPIPETAGFSPPDCAYAKAKQAAEQLFSAANSARLETVTARIFSVIGPSMPLHAHFAIGNFIGDAVAGREISVMGDGTAVRSYIYAADLAAWLAEILVRGRAGAAYNVGSDKAVSISELAKLVAETVPGARGAVVRGVPSLTPRGYYVPSISLAREQLGLDIWTPLHEAIAKTALWARMEA